MLPVASKRALCRCVRDRWKCCRVRVTGRAYVEHFCLGIGGRAVSKTFKIWQKYEYESMRIIRKEGVVEGRSQSGREP